MSLFKKTLTPFDKLFTRPFWVGYFIILLLGVFVHTALSDFFPEIFRDGVKVILKDPYSFHLKAIELAKLPWTNLELRPGGQFPVAFIATIYKLTGIYKPILLVPFLAFLGGLTVLILISILRMLGVQGRWWPILIGGSFALTPTSFSWMVYPHKDAFIVPGVLLIAWSFMSLTLRKVEWSHFLAFGFGALLVLVNKPYFAEIFFVGVILSSLLIVLFKRQGRDIARLVVFLGFVFISLGVVTLSSHGYLASGNQKKIQHKSTSSSSLVMTETKIENHELPRHLKTKNLWKPIFGGELINKPLRALAYTRERFLYERSYGNTNYLEDIHIGSAIEAIKYFPHALILSFLEPLPWRNKDKDTKTQSFLFWIVKLEMIITYFMLFFLLISGRKSWNTTVLVILALALPFLLVFGFAVPNIGTVNRYRFPFLLLIKLAGFAALWNSNRAKWPGRLLMWVDPPEVKREKKKVLFLVPDDETFLIQRLVMARGVQAAGFDVHVAAEETGAAQKIRDLGFTFHRLDLNRGGLNPLADFWPFIKLVFFLAKERPDILQCVSIKPVLYGATAGTIVGLKRIVCLINGLGYAFEGENLKGKIVKTVAMALYRNALALPGIRVIFQNPDDREYFVSHKLVSLEKTILIRGSGVDMTKFPPKPLPKNNKPKILFVGRLLWSKGIRELVESAINLKNEGLDFTLQIVGSPDDRNPNAVSTEFINKFKDKDFIEWPGRQSDMPTFYREADILCLPTKYKEGIPLTLLEAASMGRALVATDVPGCREIVRNEVNGFLIPPGNTTELTIALRKLILNPDQRISFGENSSKIVKEEFSSEIIQRELNKVYFDLLESILDKKDDLCLATP